MPARRTRDRFAIWTYTSHGEVVPCGHPSVTDAERAAAGRETVAARWQALLPRNRRRAAAQYRAGRLPTGQDMVRVWRRRDPAALRGRLGERRLAAWAEDDILHMLWRGTADEVHLGGGVQPRLWPVRGTADLWEASLRIRRLEEAVITIIPVPVRDGGEPVIAAADMLEWRGPRAPAALPSAEPLRGTIAGHTLRSAELGAPRPVTVYRPPVGPGPLPGCVLADGESAPRFARVLEPAILSGAVPPVVLVGVHSAADPARPRADLRGQEYLPRQNPARFAAHLRFVTSEVIPWATGRCGAAAGRWAAAGFSNGAAWAIAAGQRRPGVFGAVAAFSAGVVPKQVRRAARAAGARHYLAAGILEAGFRDATGEWAGRLARSGLPCRHHEWPGGHDPYWWEQQLPAALGWLLGAVPDG